MKKIFEKEDIKAGTLVKRGINRYRIGYLSAPKKICLIAVSDYWVNPIGTKEETVQYLNLSGYEVEDPL